MHNYYYYAQNALSTVVSVGYHHPGASPVGTYKGQGSVEGRLLNFFGLAQRGLDLGLQQENQTI